VEDPGQVDPADDGLRQDGQGDAADDDQAQGEQTGQRLRLAVERPPGPPQGAGGEDRQRVGGDRADRFQGGLRAAGEDPEDDEPDRDDRQPEQPRPWLGGGRAGWFNLVRSGRFGVVKGVVVVRV
jgi:hypothetical protein